MENFNFKRDTEFVFGKDTESAAGELLKKYGATKVLVHYGGGSVKKSGLLDRVEASIKAAGVSYVMLGGAQPNPIDTLVYEGIDICKREGVDFVLAVGGGSAIDSAKAIADGAVYDDDFWDFWDGKAVPEDALKLGVILTIPAAGSESSLSAVVTSTKTDKPLKRGLNSQFHVPIFAILNPELHYTLPAYQTACGVVDMMGHVIERYFSPTKDVEITDRLCEAILLAVIKEAPIAIKDPTNYAARANLTWAGTIAHNNSCGVGRVGDWASHQMEHELSALYDVAHGAGLAVMFPAWMKYVYEHDLDRFVKFATRVWGVEDSGDKKAVALAGIAAMENFFRSIGMPVNFKELGAKEQDIDRMVETLNVNMGDTIGNFKVIDMDDARKIFKLAV